MTGIPMPQRVGGAGRGLIGMPRAAPPSSAPACSSQAKRIRRDRGPNWNPQEIFVLIAAKREMYLQDLDAIDRRDLMTPDTNKWMRISQQVMQAGFSPCIRDGTACKTKWNQLIPDYKRIADYLSRTGRNVQDYWELSATERMTDGLPRQFAQDVFDAIHEWFGNRPMIQPPHVRDLLSPQDANYRTLPQERHELGEECDSEPEADDADLTQPEGFDTTEESTPPRSPRRPMVTPLRGTGQSDARGSPSLRLFTGMPPGVTPHVLSSSGTSQYSGQMRPGNTAVRRKSLSGHSVIAEATKATGAVMAAQMQEIANASRELERSKIEVQLKLFSEQMEYQREKDRRMYENSLVANENARLAIMKQGEMVSCLAQLSTVLTQGMTMTSERTSPHGVHRPNPNSGLRLPTQHTPPLTTPTAGPPFQTYTPTSTTPSKPYGIENMTPLPPSTVAAETPHPYNEQPLHHPEPPTSSGLLPMTQMDVYAAPNRYSDCSTQPPEINSVCTAPTDRP